ncbi:hypothetical protein BDF20DRAFT_844658 [Mycotypha africana]|uniref:uncharacterized protein n=1 Tax=Mycotypha africana TaxID=64632 RepID=UPI0022FFFE5F|nr:uncharacterized protein BDF20DRAFT_844658 [Mycotypha africana]KAI8991439.1 hypothetical protein BDF20DRAFT_844658 [Mycotypha africana]
MIPITSMPFISLRKTIVTVWRASLFILPFLGFCLTGTSFFCPVRVLFLLLLTLTAEVVRYFIIALLPTLVVVKSRF